MIYKRCAPCHCNDKENRFCAIYKQTGHSPEPNRSQSLCFCIHLAHLSSYIKIYISNHPVGKYQNTATLPIWKLYTFVNITYLPLWEQEEAITSQLTTNISAVVSSCTDLMLLGHTNKFSSNFTDNFHQLHLPKYFFPVILCFKWCMCLFISSVRLLNFHCSPWCQINALCILCKCHIRIVN